MNGGGKMGKFRLTSNKVEGRHYDIELETLEEAFHEAALAFKSDLITYIKIKRVKE